MADCIEGVQQSRLQALRAYCPDIYDAECWMFAVSRRCNESFHSEILSFPIIFGVYIT